MPFVNARNNATVVGTLPRAPKVFAPNADNSQSVQLVVGYLEENIRPGEKTRRWKNVSLSGYVPANADGSVKTDHLYSGLSKGSNILVNYEPFDDSYTDKDGNTIYTKVNRIHGITFLDPAGRAEELRAKAAEEQAPAPAAEPVAQAPAATEAVDPLA